MIRVRAGHFVALDAIVGNFNFPVAVCDPNCRWILFLVAEHLALHSL